VFLHPIQELAHHQKRDGFSCGVEALDDYLRKRASQDVRRKIAVAYVQLEDDGKTIAGYYTLASTSLDIGELPSDLIKKLPKYPRVPAILIGRLARDERHKGQGLGEHLLMDSLRRSYENSKRIAAAAVVVEADNEQTKSFYEKYGFVQLPDNPHKLFIMISTIAKLI